MSASSLIEGPLVIADISGYTKFVTQTEIDHSIAIVHELLDCTVSAMSGHLEVSQVEGDAVLFIGGLGAERVLELVEHCFVSFHRRGRAMREMTTCPCQACQNIQVLALKFVLHQGVYSKLRIGAIEQLHGADVILAFRLLKNHLEGAEYVLASRQFLAGLPAEQQAAFVTHTEAYDHLGVVECGHRDLRPVWRAAEASERRRVDAADAKLSIDCLLDVPIEVAWEMLGDSAVWREVVAADKVDLYPGARGTRLDGELHCHHGEAAGQVTVMRVVLADEPHTMTVTSEPGIVKEMWQTFHLEDAGEGRTRGAQHTTWEAWPGEQGRQMEEQFAPFMEQALRDSMLRMEAIARRHAEVARRA